MNGWVACQEIGYGITCIDARYIKPGLACFYLLQQGDECAIIETGTCHSLTQLERVMDEQGLAPEQVRYVIPTHVHLDHAGGAGAMMARFPRAQLLAHPRGARHLADPERLVASTRSVYGEARFRELYGEIVPVDGARIAEMDDGQSVSLAGRALEFRHTRGHADHHFCIWDEASRGWFSGDMFGLSYPWFRFPDGDFVMPATTPTQFRPDDYLHSLQLLGSYDPQQMYLTHYGKLAYSSRVAGLLARQVEAYPGLALEYGDDSGALEGAVTELSLGLLQGFDVPAGEAEMRQWLAFDADLNAQGLGVWLQRQSTATG
jgi:glyoxylase-like metal-dependent hydrolase (beta-lactamase superfamily II)